MEYAVIMSVYYADCLDYVRLSIESVLSNKNLRLYILCDGDVESAVNSYLDLMDPNIVHVIKRKENKGLACSLNELLRVVLSKEYQYIARMDADDISMPKRFEKQIEYLENHRDIDCLGTWAIEIDGNGNEYFRKNMPITHEECLAFFRKRDCMIHPTVMFRRSYFEKAGLYPEDTYFGEDTMMWAQGFKNGCRFANLPEYLFKFRLGPHFFQRRRGWKHAKSIFILRRRVNRMLELGLKEDCYAFLYAMAKMMPTRILDFIYRKIR